MSNLLSYAGRVPVAKPAKPTPARVPTIAAPTGGAAIANPAPRPAAPRSVFDRLSSKATTAATHQRITPTPRPLNSLNQAQASTNAQR